jgi:hypothetical protein
MDGLFLVHLFISTRLFYSSVWSLFSYHFQVKECMQECCPQVLLFLNTVVLSCNQSEILGKMFTCFERWYVLHRLFPFCKLMKYYELPLIPFSPTMPFTILGSTVICAFWPINTVHSFLLHTIFCPLVSIWRTHQFYCWLANGTVGNNEKFEAFLIIETN